MCIRDRYNVVHAKLLFDTKSIKSVKMFLSFKFIWKNTCVKLTSQIFGCQLMGVSNLSRKGCKHSSKVDFSDQMLHEENNHQSFR